VSGLTHTQTPLKQAPGSRLNWPQLASGLACLALALAVAAFVLTLTDDDGGPTVVREVSVTPAAEAPAHFSERPDEPAVAAAVSAAFDAPRLTESPYPGLEDKANSVGQGWGYGTSQYRVNPFTGQAEPVFGSRADGASDAGSSHPPSQYESRGGDPSRPN
jgi:hypothetical protein